MIKINLLNSVTERQGGTVVAVDRKISSPASRFALMSVAVLVLTVAFIGWDVISAQMAKADADQELARQKTIEAELAVVIAEQKELEGKIAGIDARIEAIKRLRASQAGPSAVLDAVRERISMVPGLYLESIEQKDGGLVISGTSPDETQVTQFGRSLEFSNGLFSDLSIETTRTEITNENAVMKPGDTSERPKVNLVNFKVKTSYTPSKAAGANNGTSPTTASAQSPAAPAQPGQQPQIAKN
jgi:Tfp pilus assembly protein PilN